nr:two pore calcium channel protein 2 [Hymenolepis microstoma]
MFNQFRGYLSSSIQKRMFRRRLAVFAAFQLLKSQDPEPIVESDKIRRVLEETSLSGWKKEVFLLKLEMEFSNIPLKLGEFMDLFRLLDLSSPPKTLGHIRQFYNPVASRIQSFFLSDKFRWIELSISLVNVACIIVQIVAFEEEDKPSFRFLIVNTIFALIYMAEIVLRIWLYRCRNALKHLSLFDTALSSLNLVLRLVELGLILCGLKSIPYLQWSPYNIGQVANVCVILRTVRFLQNSKLMKAILLKMPQHLAPVLGILTCLYYVYALIGLTAFHGAIEPPSDNSNFTYLCGSYQELNYWSINFDDFAASLFTLWSLMVINNWHVIVRAFTEKRGRAVHFYMLSWWLIAVVIMATLITAMIIESFLFARQQCLDESSSKNYHPNSGGVTSALRLRRRDNNSNYHDTELLVDIDVGEELNQVNQSTIQQEAATGVEIITGGQRQNLAALSSSSHHSSVTFSLAQILGGSFTEPTNEDLEGHLSRHCEIGPLINSR